MKEYIEREAAIKVIENDCSELVYYTKEDAIQCVKAIPAADVVEVVRCRECKYWGDEDGKLQRSDGLLFARCIIHNYLLDGNILGGVQRKIISVPTEKGKKVLTDG